MVFYILSSYLLSKTWRKRGNVITDRVYLLEVKNYDYSFFNIIYYAYYAFVFNFAVV